MDIVSLASIINFFWGTIWNKSLTILWNATPITEIPESKHKTTNQELFCLTFILYLLKYSVSLLANFIYLLDTIEGNKQPLENNYFQWLFISPNSFTF